MGFFCRENLEVQVYKHPHYQSLNEQLMKDISTLDFTWHEDNIYGTNIKGSQFNFISNPKVPKPKGVKLLEQWVTQIVRSGWKVEPWLNYIDVNFTTWVARLDKGQETMCHFHHPHSSLVFVYFLNTPKGSSPLVFPTSGKKVKAEAGTLVIHPSVLKHKVPPNKCDGRITIASNLYISEKDSF